MSGTIYLITVNAPPNTSDPDGTRRLRLALKRMLRSYGLRCVDIERKTTAAPDDAYARPLAMKGAR